MAKKGFYSKILISVTGYEWSPGIKSFKSRMTDEEYSDFLIFLAEKMRDEIVKAIDKQRFKGKWKPLSIKYMEYKKRNNLSTNTWEATSVLRNGVKVFFRPNKVVVGFKQREYYPNSRLQINKVAKYVEFGGSKLPPRPLFRSVFEYMRKHINQYLREYERIKKKSGRK